MYEELKDQGLEIVAVNNQARDTLENINKYAKDFSFKIVMGGQGDSYTLGKTYGVLAYPTNYLIGPDGKIVWRGVGFSPAKEKELRDELAKLGIK